MTQHNKNSYHRDNRSHFIKQMIHHRLILSLFTLLIVNLQISFALPEDRQLPLHIDADWSEFTNGTPTGTYKGNVVMVQGNLEILADKAIFQMVDGELEYIIATGDMVKIKDLPKPNEPWVYGEGRKLSYFPKKQTLELEIDAQVEQNRDVVVADKIIYNLETRVINAERKDDGRVHFTIQMENRK